MYQPIRLNEAFFGQIGQSHSFQVVCQSDAPPKPQRWDHDQDVLTKDPRTISFIPIDYAHIYHVSRYLPKSNQYKSEMLRAGQVLERRHGQVRLSSKELYELVRPCCKSLVC